MADPYIIAGEVEKRIRDIFKDALVKVLIYGSYVSGTSDPESDIDILVLVTDNDLFIEQKREAIIDIVTDISSLNNIFVSVMVRNASLFYERSAYVPFYMDIARHGVEIHG